jgi:hypothetical protein
MRIIALIIFGWCMVILALNLEGCARPDIHPSTPSLQWKD